MNTTSSELPVYAMAPEFSSIPTGHNAYDMISAQFAARIASNESGYCISSSPWSGPPSPASSVDTNKAGDAHDDGHSSASPSEDFSQSVAHNGRRANRYKNCSESVLSKRRAQNRANQRAYRKRKEQRVEELQQQLDDVNQRNEALCCAYRLLANECCRLRTTQMPMAQPPVAWNLNGANTLALDMNALNNYRGASVSSSSPIAESYIEYPGSADRLWSPYSS